MYAINCTYAKFSRTSGTQLPNLLRDGHEGVVRIGRPSGRRASRPNLRQQRGPGTLKKKNAARVEHGSRIDHRDLRGCCLSPEVSRDTLFLADFRGRRRKHRAGQEGVGESRFVKDLAPLSEATAVAAAQYYR